jgi:hypothetical protein
MKEERRKGDQGNFEHLNRQWMGGLNNFMLKIDSVELVVPEVVGSK